MKKHKWHKEIKAWADGAEIEERWISQNTEEDEWREAQTTPMWDCDGLEFRIKPQPKEPQCNPHPKAPHGFNRNASHNSNNYVCDCEGWDAWQDGYEEGLRKGLELEQPKEPQYLYVYIGENDGYIFSRFHPSKYDNPECIGKIKLEVEE